MKHYDQNLKERVISDYLSGGVTYRQLQARYGIDCRLIHQWVQAFKDSNTTKKVQAKKENVKLNEDLPKEVKQLQEELQQARLYNKLLEALVDIGKEKNGIDLRKKMAPSILESRTIMVWPGNWLVLLIACLQQAGVLSVAKITGKRSLSIRAYCSGSTQVS